MSVVTILLLNVTAIFLSNRNHKNSAVNLLALLMGGLCLLYVTALVDLLFWGAVAAFTAMAGYCIYEALKIGPHDLKSVFLNGSTTSLMLFDLSYAVLGLIFVLKRPLLYYWDELKIWGPTAKYVFQFDRLYSVGVNALPCDRNYPVGNAILTYFMHFFSGKFEDYYILLSYAVLFVAVFAAAAALVQEKTDSKPIGVGCFLSLLILPFCFIYHTPMADYSQISYAYGSTMVDCNVAVVFLAVLVLYFALENKLIYLLPLCFLITVKKNGIFFALLAFCIMACFTLFRSRQKRKPIGLLIRNVMYVVLVVALTYVGWELHLDHYQQPIIPSGYDLSYFHEDPLSEAEEEPELTDPQFLSVNAEETSVRAILIPSQRSARYQQILSEFKNYFLFNRETIFGRDIFLIIGLFLFGLLPCIYGKKGSKVAFLLVDFGLTAGCFVYSLVIGYQMQFYNDLMVEYPRYMVSYYFGWIMLQLLFFLCFVSEKHAFKLLLLCVLTVFSIRTSVLWTPQLTVFDPAENVYAVQKQQRAEFEKIKDFLSTGDRVCLVYPYLNSELWLTFRYQMLPYLCGFDTQNTNIDFSVGFCKPEAFDNSKSAVYFADEQTYLKIMSEYFDYIYVYQAEDEYITSYTNLFSDGICSNSLYKITNEAVPMRRVS